MVAPIIRDNVIFQTFNLMVQVCRVLLSQQLGDEGAELRIPLLRQQRGQAAGDQLPFLAEVNPILAVDKLDELVKIFIANIGQRHNPSSFSAGKLAIIRADH